MTNYIGHPTLEIRSLTEADLQRFWSKVAKTDECWLWVGARIRGYGKMKLHERVQSAHRVSYFIEHGPIPDRFTISHLCHNPPCVRPSHLIAEPLIVNLRRSNPRKPRGALREEEVREIRYAVSNGAKHLDLADQFNVDPGVISQVARRITYQHVKDSD